MPSDASTVKPRLLDLPDELLLQVLDYVWNPTDQANLCLCCSAMQDIVAPILYDHLVVDMDRVRRYMRADSMELRSRPAAMFTLSANKKLKHVRRLTLRTRSSSLTTADNSWELDEDRIPYDRYELDQTMKMLARQLPADCLSSFCYEGDEELPRMLYAQVCAQEQRNLRSLSILQVYQVEEPVTNYPEATFTSAKLADKEIVYSRADDWDDVNNAIACLLQTKKVKILELNWRIASIFESSPNYNPSYTGEEYDACCTNFFDRLKTEALTTDGGAKKAPLQILNLSQFNGRGIGPSLIKAFDMSQLSSLLLINSHWLDRLLNALADGRHVPHLHTLVIHSFDEEDTQSFRASIDKLLFSIHALHTLMLRIENTEEGELMWPSMVALVHHAQRLTCLHLSGTANQNFYSVSEMVELQQCQKLEELAIPIPFDPLHESFIWTTEESHTGNRMDALYDAIVPRFSKLRVLHLIADLGFADSELSGYDKDVFRVRCFSQLANIFMLRSMNAKLEILAIGNPTKARPDATAFGLPFCFKRTRVVHSTGLQLAQLCELKTVIREYPATTILQFSSSLGKRFFRVGYDYSTDNIGIAEPALRRLRPKRKASLDKYGHPFDAQRFESRSKHDTMMDVRAGATASKSRFVKLKLYGLPLKSRDLGRQRDAEAAGLGDEENNIAIAQVAEDTASPKSTESAQEDTTALIGAVAGLRL